MLITMVMMLITIMMEMITMMIEMRTTTRRRSNTGRLLTLGAMSGKGAEVRRCGRKETG